MTVDGERTASELNRELTALLVRAGKDAGFDPVVEYPVRGGRLDVVWTWAPTSLFPDLDRPVPVVGFEIESSWRTRKHVKGDLLNLQDAGVGLGVIVLAGTSDQDDGLRKFAALLVDRPGPTVLIWTADDVRELSGATSGGTLATVTAATASGAGGAYPPATATSPEPAGDPSPSGHSGKYAPLYRWLRSQEVPTLTATFGGIEEVLGFPLPNSCRQHVAHWHSYDGSAVSRAIIDAGWKASQVHLADETLTLTRTST